jgi:hypothetical protein
MTFSTSAVAVCCWRAQLGEEPRVLNGDDGLRGEVRHQLDLFIGKWQNVLAVNRDSANQIVFLEHRNQQKRASSADVRELDNSWTAVAITFVCGDVVNVDDLLRLAETSNGDLRVGVEDRVAHPLADERSGNAVQRDCPESAALRQPEETKLCPANPRRIPQHGVKDRLQFAWRA